ncbi:MULTISPECIES: hypothetical protein, partial [Delftia]|uniref:hypothetical protein n=1 Tax=Delftia TaxID=80865 RepID=UPI000648765C
MRVLVYIGAVIAAICLLFSFFVTGAPQQAALAGMACAFAIIPYVLFRVQATAIAEDHHRELMELLKQKQ